jgi:acylphosphatase
VTVARRLVVRGLVQGVNYRAWLRERAASRGVDGWASNEPDGSVEVWLQGEPGAVAEVERAAAEGPRWAEVDAVDGSDAQPRDDVRGFGRR